MTVALRVRAQAGWMVAWKEHREVDEWAGARAEMRVDTMAVLTVEHLAVAKVVVWVAGWGLVMADL